MAATDETFEGMAQMIALEFSRPDSESLVAAKIAVARALQNIRFDRFDFTESTFSLTIVPNQDEYDVATATPTPAGKLPADLLYIDNVQLIVNSLPRRPTLQRYSMGEYRHLQGTFTVKTGRPLGWVFRASDANHLGAFLLWPIPTNPDVVRIDYGSDATRTVAGDEITPGSTSETNIWFKRRGGEGYLRPLAAADFALTFLNDAQTATQYAGLAMKWKMDRQRHFAEQALSSGTVTPYGPF